MEIDGTTDEVDGYAVDSSKSKGLKPDAIGTLVNVVVTTARFDLMIQFYSHRLGLQVIYRDETSCFFKTGRTNLVLVRSRARAGKRAERVCLDFGVPSVAATGDLLKAGGLILETDRPEMIQFRDPDGNLIEIVPGG